MNIPKKRFLTFLSIGAFNTLLDALIFTALILVFGISTLNILILNITSFSIVMLSAFYLNGKFTFKDGDLSLRKFIKYYMSSSFGMALNTALVIILISSFGLGTIISKIIAACIVVIYNYTMCKKFIFEIKL